MTYTTAMQQPLLLLFAVIVVVGTLSSQRNPLLEITIIIPRAGGFYGLLHSFKP